jgi:hypothetical protein
MEPLKTVALEILRQHGHATKTLEYLGAGEQSVCYGAGDLAILLDQGHALQGTNDYRLQRRLTACAVKAGVKTPQILAVGDHPQPYALMQRAFGIKAGELANGSEDVASWFGSMGEEIRKVNRIPTDGFGPFILAADGQYRGQYATWDEYLNDQLAKYLGCDEMRGEERRVQALFLAQEIISERELDKIAAKLDEAKAWQVYSVLTHYDNRLDNLMVNGKNVMLLDWGLAYAGIGIRQELIKLFEVAPTSLADPNVAAFLRGYGLVLEQWEEVLEGAKLMLILDGLSMSYGWADDPGRIEGIRAWLRTIKNICDEW